MKKYLLLIPLLLLLLVKPVIAAGPHLSVSPTSGSYGTGSTFDVKMSVDCGTEKAASTDVVLKFPANLLEVKTITDGKAFTNFYPSHDNTAGKILISGSMPPGATGYITGVKEMATINFLVKATGTAGVTFDCTSGMTNESNITKQIDSLDVIECSANVGGSYTLTSGGGSSPTATPTAGAAIPTPRPTATPVGGETKGGVPAAGNELPTLFLLFSGAASVITGWKLKRYHS